MSGATYCTLGQFGFGAWIDVKCTSEPTEDGGILHWLHFVLVGGPNQDTLGMGEVYVTQHDPAKPEVYSDMFDEDEDRFFPDIDAAIQGHLAWMTEVD